MNDEKNSDESKLNEIEVNDNSNLNIITSFQQNSEPPSYSPPIIIEAQQVTQQQTQLLDRNKTPSPPPPPPLSEEKNLDFSIKSIYSQQDNNSQYNKLTYDRLSTIISSSTDLTLDEAKFATNSSLHITETSNYDNNKKDDANKTNNNANKTNQTNQKELSLNNDLDSKSAHSSFKSKANSSSTQSSKIALANSEINLTDTSSNSSDCDLDINNENNSDDNLNDIDDNISDVNAHSSLTANANIYSSSGSKITTSEPNQKPELEEPKPFLFNPAQTAKPSLRSKKAKAHKSKHTKQLRNEYLLMANNSSELLSDLESNASSINMKQVKQNENLTFENETTYNSSPSAESMRKIKLKRSAKPSLESKPPLPLHSALEHEYDFKQHSLANCDKLNCQCRRYSAADAVSLASAPTPDTNVPFDKNIKSISELKNSTSSIIKKSSNLKKSTSNSLRPKQSEKVKFSDVEMRHLINDKSNEEQSADDFLINQQQQQQQQIFASKLKSKKLPSEPSNENLYYGSMCSQRSRSSPPLNQAFIGALPCDIGSRAPSSTSSCKPRRLKHSNTLNIIDLDRLRSRSIGRDCDYGQSGVGNYKNI
jgi:hypothetical protein